MTAATRVEAFLKSKMKEYDLKRVHIAQKAAISSYTINSIFKGDQQDVTFKTILRLANYFNCTVDEVLGRQKETPNNSSKYKSVSVEASMDAIRAFINLKMIEEKSDIYKFASNMGFHKKSLREFLQEPDNKKTIGGNSVLIIFDKFDTSIDQIIGRKEGDHKISLSLDKKKINIQTSKFDHNLSLLLQKLSSQDIENFEKIKTLLKPHQTKPEDRVNSGNSPTTKVKKTSHNR